MYYIWPNTEKQTIVTNIAPLNTFTHYLLFFIKTNYIEYISKSQSLNKKGRKNIVQRYPESNCHIDDLGRSLPWAFQGT